MQIFPDEPPRDPVAPRAGDPDERFPPIELTPELAAAIAPPHVVLRIFDEICADDALAVAELLEFERPGVVVIEVDAFAADDAAAVSIACHILRYQRQTSGLLVVHLVSAPDAAYQIARAAHVVTGCPDATFDDRRVLRAESIADSIKAAWDHLEFRLDFETRRNQEKE